MTNYKALTFGLWIAASGLAMISGLIGLIAGVYEPAILTLLISIQGTLFGMRLDAIERCNDD